MRCAHCDADFMPKTVRRRVLLRQVPRRGLEARAGRAGSPGQGVDPRRGEDSGCDARGSGVADPPSNHREGGHGYTYSADEFRRVLEGSRGSPPGPPREHGLARGGPPGGGRLGGCRREGTGGSRASLRSAIDGRARATPRPDARAAAGRTRATGATGGRRGVARGGATTWPGTRARVWGR
jgi:hypothetical protein